MQGETRRDEGTEAVWMDGHGLEGAIEADKA